MNNVRTFRIIKSSIYSYIIKTIEYESGNKNQKCNLSSKES
jgi:hypothetical protein